MAADEQQPQHVVAVVRRRRAARRRSPRRRRGRRSSRRAAARLRCALAARLVERGVAADEDQPGGGIARRAVLRPVLQRAQAGFLERLLGACRGRGNSAAARRPPAGRAAVSAASIQARSVTSPRLPGVEDGERADLEAPPGSALPRLARDRRAPRRASRSRRRRSRAAAPWSRRTARRCTSGSAARTRTVVAAVVGISRSDRPELALGRQLLARRRACSAMTASSFSLDQAPTAASWL